MKKFLWVGVIAAFVASSAVSEVVENDGDENTTVIQDLRRTESNNTEVTNIDSGNVNSNNRVTQVDNRQQDIRINSPTLNADNKTKIVIRPERQPDIAYRPAVEAVMVHRPIERLYAPSITPMLGTTLYAGGWARSVENMVSLGLIFEVPLTPFLSWEIEGGYASSDMRSLVYRERFNQYSLGSNAKIYLSRGVFQPYVGAGIHGVYHAGRGFGPTPYSALFGWQNPNDGFTGNGQLDAGADIAITQTVAIGGRAAWVVPLFHRPMTVTSPGNLVSAPFSVYNNLMNTSYFKLAMSVRVSL